MHATVASTTNNVHSGQIFALPADRAVNGPNAVLPGTDPPDLIAIPATDPRQGCEPALPGHVHAYRHI
jgi:hypothetical protein